MRRCRFCAEEIQDASRVCEHCGKDLFPGRPATVANAPAAVAPITVTTGDLRRDYDILGPVYFQVSKQGQTSAYRTDWGFLYGEWSVGQSQFEQAFFVAVQELKVRAAMLGADAVIAMRQDIDLDTEGFQFFYLQMYGTAVKYKAPSPTLPGVASGETR
jgi:uncharacterized protein YbjQ (UPF0145 family)